MGDGRTGSNLGESESVSVLRETELFKTPSLKWSMHEDAVLQKKATQKLYSARENVL